MLIHYNFNIYQFVSTLKNFVLFLFNIDKTNKSKKNKIGKWWKFLISNYLILLYNKIIILNITIKTILYLNYYKFRIYFRIKNKFFKNFSYNYYYGLSDFIKYNRIWFISIILGLFILCLFSYIKNISINRIVFTWIWLIIFFYWTYTSFVFFFKKYYYAKFTTANQRFWKRTLMLFWCIELFLFFCFFFLTLISNSEPFFMLDQIQLFKNRLVSIRIFIINLFPYMIIICLTYLLSLILKWQTFSKYIIFSVLITFILIYIVFNEFYQFFHIVNFYSFINWIYDIDERIWNLELDPQKTRTVNHYVSLLIMIKFWHIVVIFFIWLFLILRAKETKRIRYPLLSGNFQNFLFLYLFCWVLLYPWLKFFYRHFFDISYYWFYINFRKIGFLQLFNDLKIFYFSFFDNLCFWYSFIKFQIMDFFYWHGLSHLTNNWYIKNYIKDFILKSLYNL